MNSARSRYQLLVLTALFNLQEIIYRLNLQRESLLTIWHPLLEGFSEFSIFVTEISNSAHKYGIVVPVLQTPAGILDCRSSSLLSRQWYKSRACSTWSLRRLEPSQHRLNKPSHTVWSLQHSPSSPLWLAWLLPFRHPSTTPTMRRLTPFRPRR